MLFKQKKVYCPNCRKLSFYKIKSRIAIAELKIPKEIEVKYTKKYGICKSCKKRIFVPGLDDKNVKRLERKILSSKFKIGG